MSGIFPHEIIALIASYRRSVFAAIRRTCRDLRHIRGGRWAINATIAAPGARVSTVTILESNTILVPDGKATYMLVVDSVLVALTQSAGPFRAPLVRELYLAGAGAPAVGYNRPSYMFVYESLRAYTRCDIKRLRPNDYFTFVPPLALLVNEGADIGTLNEYAPEYTGTDPPGNTSGLIRVHIRASLDTVAEKMNLDFCNYQMEALRFDQVKVDGAAFKYTDRYGLKYNSSVQVPLWKTLICRVDGRNISDCTAPGPGHEYVKVTGLNERAVFLKQPLSHGLNVMCNTEKRITQPGRYIVEHDWDDSIQCHRLLSAHLVR